VCASPIRVPTPCKILVLGFGYMVVPVLQLLSCLYHTHRVISSLGSLFELEVFSTVYSALSGDAC
jgi:hypothetical protein